MTQKRALMACSNYWNSPFQVGSHHIARGLVRAGYQVAFLSDPLSPWHLARGWTRDVRQRLALYRSGGRDELDGRLWTYVPGALVTPHNKPVLRSELVHRRWQRWTMPNLAALIRERGFDRVDLLYIDSVHQSFWLDAITYEQSLYRAADYNPHFEKYTPATRILEQEMAQRVDLVVYPSQKLQGYVEELGARRRLLLANGVDYAHFAKPAAPLPAEYRSLRGPIAVYVGVLPDWFHFAWLRQAATQLPGMTFVLIGPEKLARQRLGSLPNVLALGVRDYADVPGYLQHAHVGLMPFDLDKNPRGVEVLQPQKLYAYLASGLPVVASDWENLRALNAPVQRCASAQEFVRALERAVAAPGDREAYRRYASGFDWNRQVIFLLEELAKLRQPLPARAGCLPAA